MRASDFFAIQPVANGGSGASTAQGAAANLGVPFAAGMKGGIPLIGLSSGSVAANGAISAITALPVAYPSAYCWFPANILATVKAAGWYYCTFSTTTAGVAFLDTYTSGVPSIPASPTAVTDGKGAFTGDTGEEFGHTYTIPANSLGANGALRISTSYSQNNTANNKTVRVRWSGNGGTIFFIEIGASITNMGFVGLISNTGNTAKNLSQTISTSGSSMTTSSALGTIDTTAQTSLVFSIQRATATDNIIVLPPTIEIISDGT